jgi:hypothetical protein
MASRLTPLENELWKKLKGARDSVSSCVWGTSCDTRT